ncbi:MULTISPECIES: nucleotide disphospho-sugar-binding domain-containing protein [unclassified Streptomyces]|uniref:glycosyltransferase n=1 Tax=unclassified Streptomyces TaxID=2593676 RepID=UPI00333038B4
MSTILLATLAASGHVNPFGPVATELVARGHRVIWYTGTAYADRVARTGAAFAPPTYGRFVDLDRLTDEYPEFLSLPPDARGPWFLEHVFVRPVKGQYRDLKALMALHGADVLLADSTMAAASFLHELHGELWATLSVAPMAIPDPWVPPFGKGWPPGRQPWRRVRNWYTERSERRRFPEPLDQMNVIRRELGLSPVRSSPFDANLTPYLYAQATVAEFEYPRRRLPEQVHFVGPLFPAAPPPGPLPAWWPELEKDRPVVLVTQGTGAHDLGELVVPTVQALAGQDITVVVTTGGASHSDLDPGSLPANVHVEPFLPYAGLMPHLSAMVTNGGYGTVQLALAHGVPIVAAGVTEDKPEVCARLAWSGAGIDLRSKHPPVPVLVEAVRTVLTDPGYRQKASAMRTVFAGRRAPQELTVLLEELIATRRPVLAARR